MHMTMCIAYYQLAVIVSCSERTLVARAQARDAIGIEEKRTSLPMRIS